MATATGCTAVQQQYGVHARVVHGRGRGHHEGAAGRCTHRRAGGWRGRGGKGRWGRKGRGGGMRSMLRVRGLGFGQGSRKDQIGRTIQAHNRPAPTNSQQAPPAHNHHDKPHKPQAEPSNHTKSTSPTRPLLPPPPPAPPPAHSTYPTHLVSDGLLEGNLVGRGHVLHHSSSSSSSRECGCGCGAMWCGVWRGCERALALARSHCPDEGGGGSSGRQGGRRGSEGAGEGGLQPADKQLTQARAF